MIKKALKLITPPVFLALPHLLKPRANAVAPADRLEDLEKRLEYVDFWAHTSLFALDVLRRHGPLGDMTLFSLGNRMAHLADYMGLFGKIYHNTTIKTLLPVESKTNVSEVLILEQDFFDLPQLDIDCVISHAAIHCLNDTRYGNIGLSSGWQRPYQAATKLREIIGPKSIPIIVSIAVHESESFIDDNARLSHDKFVSSFRQAGFTLNEHFFDYLCYGMPFREEYLKPEYRRSSVLPSPEQAASDYNYVIGNYYFS